MTMTVQRKLCVCVCACHVCWIPKHDSGTFQREGKDFSGRGNLAQDKHAAGVTAYVPLLKCPFHSKGCWFDLNWGRIFCSSTNTWVTSREMSKINCDGGKKKNLHILVCTPLNISNFLLQPCLPELPHVPLIAGWFTAHRTSPLICPLVKPPTQQPTATVQNQHLWTRRSISTHVFPRGHMQSLYMSATGKCIAFHGSTFFSSFLVLFEIPHVN